MKRPKAYSTMVLTNTNAYMYFTAIIWTGILLAFPHKVTFKLAIGKDKNGEETLERLSNKTTKALNGNAISLIDVNDNIHIFDRTEIKRIKIKKL